MEADTVGPFRQPRYDVADADGEVSMKNTCFNSHEFETHCSTFEAGAPPVGSSGPL